MLRTKMWFHASTVKHSGVADELKQEKVLDPNPNQA